MSVSAINKHKLTFEAYTALPETMQRYEIIDGEMIISPTPTTRHQMVLGNFYRALHEFVTRGQRGVVILSPTDIIVRRKPKLRTRQPDLIFVSNARKEIIADMVEGGPDLVVEILSPKESRSRIATKLDDYRKIGVSECWLVSIEAETVEVLQLTSKSEKRAGLYGAGDHVKSQVLSGLSLPVSKLLV